MDCAYRVADAVLRCVDADVAGSVGPLAALLSGPVAPEFAEVAVVWVVGTALPVHTAIYWLRRGGRAAVAGRLV